MQWRCARRTAYRWSQSRARPDLTAISFLQGALDDALISRPRRLEADFAHVTFCDCSGLNALLKARAAALQADAAFALVHADAPAVIRLLGITGTGPLLGLGRATA
ncbi:STAS domain-containing protein [Streptomyces sp. NBC_01367]|uniref:STAS domain-containing protein n=1 Tax=Streptomyces sp. NBC_01367 TaxID=2903841 RepID=UPI00324B1573